METNPAHELDEIQRLRADTLTEARKTPRGAFVLMFGGLIGWFAGYALIEPSPTWTIAWIALWWVFFVAWMLWVRSGSRARQPTDPLTRRETMVRIVEWSAIFALSQLIVWFGSRISWVLVGVGLALLSVGQVLINRERWLRWFRHGAR